MYTMVAVPVKRRVAALREVQSDYDTLIKQFQKERAELQAKYEKQAGGSAKAGWTSQVYMSAGSALLPKLQGHNSMVSLAAYSSRLALLLQCISRLQLFLGSHTRQH